MSVTLRIGAGAAILGAVLIAAWVRSTLDAQLMQFESRARAFALAPAPGPAAPPSTGRGNPVFVPVLRDDEPIEVAPPTLLAARTWAALLKPLDRTFPPETALEDILTWIRNATRGTDLPDGIPIYLDPPGLQEAEQTAQSPVTLDFKEIPMATALELMLRQLDLRYGVRSDGILAITYVGAKDSGILTGPIATQPDSLHALREEVASLRMGLAQFQAGMTVPQPPTQQGGGRAYPSGGGFGW